MPLDPATLQGLLRNLTPQQIAALGTSRDPQVQDLAGTLMRLGTLGNRGPLAALPTQATPPIVSQDTTVNVQGSPRAASPAAMPMNPDEAALVSQAGFAGAGEAAANAAADYRSSPVQVLTAALAGYNKARYGAQQDLGARRLQEQEFQIRKAQVEAAVQEQKAKADARQRVLDAANQLPPDQRDKFLLLNGIGATDQAAEVISPKRLEPKVVGNTLFDPNTNSPIFTAPEPGMTAYQRAELALRQAELNQNRGANSYRLLTPDEVKAAGLPPGAYQANGRGQISQIGSGGGGDGYHLLSPEEVAAAGLPPGNYQQSAKGEIKPITDKGAASSEGERERQRAIEVMQAARTSGGFDRLKPEDVAFYERYYREKSKPQIGLDPSTGLIVSTTPDVSDLLLPPSMQPKGSAPPPAMPAPDDFRGSPVRPPQPGGNLYDNVPGAEPIAPRPAPAPLPTGPTAARVPVSSQATKEQIDQFNKSVAATNDLTSVTREIRDLIASNGGQTAFVGPTAQKLRVLQQRLVSNIGQLGNIGVISPTEAEGIKAQLGDPTTITGYLKNASGVAPLSASLDELDRVARMGVKNRGTEVRTPTFATDAEANDGVANLPSGAVFYAPNEQGILTRYTKK